MENVILIVHLLLALALIGVVLLQRSEGGGLGMGGGGGGGAMTGRSAATALGKMTWLLAIAFIGTSITLTILAAANSNNASVLDRLTDQPVPAPAQQNDLLPPASDLLPPAEAEEKARQAVQELEWEAPWYVISAVSQQGTRELAQNIMTHLEEMTASNSA